MSIRFGGAVTLQGPVSRLSERCLHPEVALRPLKLSRSDRKLLLAIAPQCCDPPARLFEPTLCLVHNSTLLNNRKFHLRSRLQQEARVRVQKATITTKAEIDGASHEEAQESREDRSSASVDRSKSESIETYTDFIFQSIEQAHGTTDQYPPPLERADRDEPNDAPTVRHVQSSQGMQIGEWNAGDHPGYQPLIRPILSGRTKRGKVGACRDSAPKHSSFSLHKGSRLVLNSAATPVYRRWDRQLLEKPTLEGKKRGKIITAKESGNMTKILPLNYPAHWDSPGIDLFTNGDWKRGSAVYLAHKIWGFFQREKENAGSVSEVLSEYPISKGLYEKLFPTGSDAGVLRNNWSNLPERSKIYSWRPVLLSCLVTDVERTIIFLEVTSKHLSYVPWMYEFALNVLWWWRRDQLNADVLLLARYAELVRWAIQKTLEADKTGSWQIIHVFLQYATREQGERIFDMLLRERRYALPGLSLGFMNFFTKFESIEYALEAFRMAAKDPSWLTNDLMLNSCAALLRLDYVEGSEQAQNFRILPELLASGLEPNLVLHNLAISNSFKVNLSTVGQAVFDHMKREHLSTDSYTYLALLQDSARKGEMTRLLQILEDINQRPDLANNLHIISHTLHAIRLLHSGDSPSLSTRAFDQMLSLYSKRLRLAPLQHLINLPVSIDYSVADEGRKDPSPLILQQMICSYILTAAPPDDAIQLWNRFTHLVTHSDEIAISLTSTDHVYNAFLIHFSRHAHQSSFIVQTLDFFLQASQQHQQTHCKPSSESFVIAAVGFLRHQKLTQARQVMKLMWLKGLKPEKGFLDKIGSQSIADLRDEAVRLFGEIEAEAETRNLSSPQISPSSNIGDEKHAHGNDDVQATLADLRQWGEAAAEIQEQGHEQDRDQHRDRDLDHESDHSTTAELEHEHFESPEKLSNTFLAS